MPDFLLELRSEEIPARMQAGARGELERLFQREMEAAGVSHGEITVWSTPRRLALIARGLPVETEAVREESKGPPEAAADQAVEGFCRKTGVKRDQLEVRDINGRPTYFAVVEKPGRAVRGVLAEAIPAIIRDFSWPKSMRWGGASIGTESLRWVRPLSGIVALLGKEIVECEVHGVTSGAVTLGHRFHHQGDITIGGADDYAMKLRAAHVIVDHEERQNLIRTGAALVATEAGLTLVEDEGLVVENAGLTEWPIPLLGRFEEEFLDVPPEVIQLTARVNQKYFVCEDESGKLANTFICTANIEAADGGAAIADGNRKVLAARLSDARFFWDVDRKKSLASHAEGLERITFHERLGTVADKVDRVAKLARWLVEEGIVSPSIVIPANAGTQSGGDGSQSLGSRVRGNNEEIAKLADLAEQAARLCKADLVTEMVGEFPELQGVMGGYYARAEGLPREVADAIRDHYKPVGQGDEVPTAPVTVAVSLADKLDTLVGFFLIEQPPTGSKDPFALRRASLGVAQLVQNAGFRLPLLVTLANAVTGYVETALNWCERTRAESTETISKWRGLISSNPFAGRLKLLDNTQCELVDAHADAESAKKLLQSVRMSSEELISKLFVILKFFADRLKVQQREAGVRHDLIDAVFALGGEDDLVRLLARVQALQTFIETEEGANLLAGYKRAANILKKENHSLVTPANAGAQRGDDQPGDLDSRVRGNDDSDDSALEPHTGEEDPFALVDDPAMREVVAARIAQKKAQVKTLSYTPEPAEKALIDALDTAEPLARAAVVQERFGDAMSALARLRGPIDAFFEEVTVNDDDPAKRTARLDLLARFRDAVHQVADFSQIEG